MYKGKRLLILGGFAHMIDVVELSKKVGIYTVVVDYDSKSPAKIIADKSYDISTSDIDRLIEIALLEKIDGVFSGFEDFNTFNAYELCKRLCLPFYATKEQLLVTSDKLKFKELCIKHNIPVVPEYDIRDNSNLIKIEFPTIVKPVDSYGSKGITVCYSNADLKEAIEKAQSFSKSKEVIVEKYIDSIGVEAYYTIYDGEIVLTAIDDRYTNSSNDGNTPLPICAVFPSKNAKYIVELNSNFKNMIKDLGIKNGVLLIQALVDDGKCYVYEMGYRLTGEKHYQIVDNQMEINLLLNMIHYSLYGSLYDDNILEANYRRIKYPSCNLSIILDKGEIDVIEGLDEVLQIPEIIGYVQTLEVGDQIKVLGSYQQMFIRFNIVAKSEQKMIEIINNINMRLRVLSKDKKDMIITKFDPLLAWSK